jgi:long-chain acyl-CoA synthetase
MNLVMMLEKAAESFADKTAVAIGERRVTYAELEETSNRVASALLKMGIKKGDRIATIQSSSPEFVAVFFGILKAGGINVPLDARYVADELANLFGDCQPRILVTEDPPLTTLLPALPRFKSIEHVIDMSARHGDKFPSYRQIIADSPATKVDMDIPPDDAAVISYTGGPTRNPHGVVLSHQSLYTEAVNSGNVLKQTDKDVLMAFALPMYHQFGLTSVLLGAMAKGSTVVVVPGTGRSIHNFMEAIEREKGTIYMGVPYIYALMINVARREGIKHDLSSICLYLSGGAPLEIPVIHQFKQYYGFDILDVWGQTESVSHATCQPIDGSGKPGATGKPLPCWEMKIFDDDDRELPPNHEGEIVLRGPSMTGFYNKPEATARTLRNGWLHTGDTGRIDEDGYLFITGRKRRLIILKGQNIFPGDIEEVLMTHPKIAEAKVVGVPELVRGETVKAMIRLKHGEKATEMEIRQFCQNRMADYKLPKEIAFMAHLPEAVPVWSRQKYLEAAEISLE